MRFDPSFSRIAPPQAVKPCSTPCAMKRSQEDQLSTAVQKRIESLTGRPEPATGKVAGEEGPVMYSADATPCQRQAYTLGPTLRRFNRYRTALPYAAAANDMAAIKNKRKPGKPLKAPSPPADSCLERLSGDADELCDQLGIPQGTIKNEDLRDDDTGFLATVYRDQGSGELMLVANDTDPNSMIDWKTNLENSAGRKTDQYNAARRLAEKLKVSGVDYNIAGYSKGGGMAQLMGLVNDRANVVVFNSAGLPDNFASPDDLAALTARTSSYSAEGDLLTFMNETTDPAQLVENAEFLKAELLGEGAGYDPMAVDHRNPANPKGGKDPKFEQARKDLAAMMDDQIAKLKQDGKPPPPVRASHKEVVKDSDKWYATLFGAKNDEPNLGKQVQHLMSHVHDPMRDSVDDDKAALENFLDRCG